MTELCSVSTKTVNILARDVQAKLALIITQIYPCPSICLSVRDSLESMGALYSSKFCSKTIIGFFY